MKRLPTQLLAVTAFLFLPVAMPVVADALEVTVEPENIISSKLEGHWEISIVVSQFLGGELPFGKRPTIEFTRDNSILDRLPENYKKEVFVDRTIYMAGNIVVEDEIYPFVLMELQGNAHVVFFEEKEGDPFGDSESFNVMLVPGEEDAKDLLFIGGDFNNQQFIAFVRSPYRNGYGSTEGDSQP